MRLLHSSTDAAVGGRATLLLTAAAALYACLVYLRLYPAIYLPALVVFVATRFGKEDRDRSKLPTWRQCMHSLLWGAWFVLVFIACYAALVTACHTQFGWLGIEQSILYHFGRSDHRHNFSPHFLEAFLSYEVGAGSILASGEFTRVLRSLASFAPQATVITLMAVRFTESSLSATLLLQTMVFVSMNKVCTAQYFMWYMCLFPVAVAVPPHPHSDRRLDTCILGANKGSIMWVFPLLWGLSVGLWLLSAYQLEFSWELLCDFFQLCDLNMFALVWVCSLLFYSVNIVCITACMYSLF